jgi:hypothetical protein
MAKLSKTLRRGAGGAVRSQFVQGILRDLIKAALIAAAEKFAESGTAANVKRKAKRAVGTETRKGKAAGKRKSPARR